MITIRHTHAEGTILSGSVKGDGVYELVKPHGFRYSSLVGIYIRASRDKDAQRWRIDAAAKALRDNGFDVTVEIDDQWRPAAERETDRAGRADERADRLDGRAVAAAKRRDARQDAARRTLDAIPMGQPMLVDHYSYAADRRRRDRAWSNMDTALEEDRYARRLAGRAEAARGNEDAKHGSRAILRRIERLEADLRGWQRALESSTNGEHRQRAQRQIDRISEDLAHQRAKVDDRTARGEFVPWAPEHFARGDLVCLTKFGLWYQVTRVNRKSVSVANDGFWPSTIAYHAIGGRRRDGWQIDTPHGTPWPSQLADKVSRWATISQLARNAQPHDEESRRRQTHVRFATRLVHGLDLSAGEAEVQAFWPADTDPQAQETRRELAARYVEIYDRLHQGETVPDVAASSPPADFVPRWSVPDSDGTPMRPHDLHPGDLVKGVWQDGNGGRELWRHFAGPVAEVGPVVNRHETGHFVTVTLDDGTSKTFATHQWLAVFPAQDADGGDAR